MKKLTLINNETKNTKEFSVELTTKGLFELLKSWGMIEGYNYHGDFIKAINQRCVGYLTESSSYKDLQGKKQTCYKLSSDDFNELLGFYTKGKYAVCLAKIVEKQKEVIDDYKSFTLTEILADPRLLGEAFISYGKQLEEKDIEIAQKNERIELITDKVNDRASKKKLRQDIYKMCIQYDKKCGFSSFGVTISDCYNTLLSNRAIDWYEEFQNASNKLEYFATKDIRWLKELHDIAVSITGGLMKPQRIVDVEQEYIPS